MPFIENHTSVCMLHGQSAVWLSISEQTLEPSNSQFAEGTSVLTSDVNIRLLHDVIQCRRRIDVVTA